MKKILLTSFIVALGLLGASCKDDNNAAGGGGEILPDQQVSCEIFMPTNGETVIISDKLIIRGEGTTNYGKIISAELKVGGEVITDISSVPFYYEYTFPKEAEPGELKIELAVKGDHEDSDIKTDLGKAYLKAYGAYYNLPAALQGETALGEDETRNIKGVCPDGWHIPSQKEWQTLSKYVLDSGMAAIMSDGQVDETAIAKALASTTMWMLPEYTEIEPQPTWVGVEMEKNNATLFNGLPIGFRACAGDEDWMHTCYSAGWWSSTAGVQMGPEFGITVRLWSDLHTFVTNAEFNPGVGLPVRCIKD